MLKICCFDLLQDFCGGGVAERNGLSESFVWILRIEKSRDSLEFLETAR